MDDPLILGLVILGVVVIIGVVVFFVLKKKQAQDDEPEEEEPVRRHRNSHNNKNKDKAEKEQKSVKSSSSPVAEKKAVQEEKYEETDNVESGEELESEWDWGTSNVSTTVDDTKVSVQDVDPLTEFNVYKQFGYVDKAAESLAAYLQNHPEKNQDKGLVGELLDLWLEAKKVDEFSDALNQYQNLFDTEALAEYIKKGLAVDENHLGLRVLAEARLGWTVKQTATEIGETTEAQTSSGAERSQTSAAKKKAEEEQAAAQAKAARKELVKGTVNLSAVSDEEKGTVLAFMQPEQSVKLLKGFLNYETANRYLNKAIRASSKPAALLIDALTMDFKAKNLNSFVEHLWNLYYSLGQGGRQVKERMLGLGYSMGEHPVFGALEANPTDTAVLREVGIRHGFVETSAAAKKGRHKNLVTETSDSDAEPKTPAERVLKEAEFYLMYGQLDESMSLLEGAIKEYPQESQLYITLFDLYERAEEWGRLENLLKDLRMQIQSLPEEVVLAMSQLLQRFNNGSFGR